MNQDFLDLLRAFIDRNVRFLIVGAYALGVHGRPRATGDLDVWVDANPDNAPKIMRALEQFGAPTEQASVVIPVPSGACSSIGSSTPGYRISR